MACAGAVIELNSHSSQIAFYRAASDVSNFRLVSKQKRTTARQRAGRRAEAVVDASDPDARSERIGGVGRLSGPCRRRLCCLRYYGKQHDATFRKEMYRSELSRSLNYQSSISLSAMAMKPWLPSLQRNPVTTG
jgi:cell fate regulator YaaT (PSP1 superfamily)